ncbi:proteasome component PRE2 [Radiomyces spectabilis]|uniref:proteasome component PRE2 n=1 Tax=Radiomyces spectabilis TaxID=64574 RepID=UPI00221EEC93|nr:proteasome component PRE2 [Radiomyces spectabilis]KAI8374249.1 proteasome component PRE2 [Radiomyces spectabilis]
MHRFVQKYSTSPLHLPQERDFGTVCGKWDAAQDLAYPTFDIPAVHNPVDFLRSVTDENSPDYRIKIQHGTTTLAFKFQGGVVVAVDSRATMGNYIASQTVKKVIEINRFLLGTLAGGAADCQYWERELGRRARLYELRNKERISVAAASKMLANMVYAYKGMGLSMGTMVTGWDKSGPNLFYVDSDGQRLKGERFSVGSGSTFAYGVLDSGYDFDLSVADALELGKRSIYHATHRDAMSGGSVNLYHVTEGGWEFHGNHDVGALHWEYQDEIAKSAQ